MPYQNERALPLIGAALSGTGTQIVELIRRYNSTDSSHYGSSRCTVSKG